MSDAELEQLERAAGRVFSGEEDVLAAYVYGSVARRQAAADLDIAVLCVRGPDPRHLEVLAGRLQEQGAPRGPEVDLRPLNGAAPRFQANVLREGRVVYERDRLARLEQEAHLMSRWLDFKPTWEVMRRRMFRRWADG